MARTITDQLRAAAHRRPLIELGAGEGGFTRRLREAGLDCLALDLRYPPAPHAIKAVGGDARRLPFGDGSAAAILAPNLLRHLDPEDRAAFARESLRVLDAQGLVVIFEDHPEGRDEAERNYRRTLELLQRAVPRRVSASVGMEQVELALEEFLGPPYDRGVHENAEQFSQPFTPLDWLHDHAPELGEELRELRHRVEKHGMSYGRFWSLIYLKPGGASP